MKKLNFLALVFCLGLIFSSCEKQKDYSVTLTANVTSNTSMNTTISTLIITSEELEGQGLMYSQYEYSLDLGYYYYPCSYCDYNEEGRILDTQFISDRTYVLTNLRPNTKYYFRLFAVNEGLAKYSNVSTFTTP